MLYIQYMYKQNIWKYFDMYWSRPVNYIQIDCIQIDCIQSDWIKIVKLYTSGTIMNTLTKPSISLVLM